MGDLVPYTPPPLPALADGDLSFRRLVGKVALLASAALALKEGLHVLRRRMEKDADDADRLAEMCAEAEVEPRFTALITDAGTALRKVATASGELVGAADEMEANARAFGDAHRSEYGGIYDAVQSSGVKQARPGFYRKH